MTKKIEPSILKGTRDFLPKDMAKRQRALSVIQNTFQQFGYEQIETPILSYAETVLGKETGDNQKLAYTFKDYGERDVALPFDLTMPFARFVAANAQALPIPFKRWQIQRVWRAERPQRGRLREFYQCDVDIIGSNNLTCEAELTKLIVTVFTRLKIKDITIRINSRRLLNQILTDAGVSKEQLVPSIRLIDKLDKIGEKKVAEELDKIGVKNGLDIIALLKPSKDNKATLDKLAKYDKTELEDFLNLCQQFEVAPDKVVVDPSLARGLDYYTGITFEVVAPNSDLGTICAGGRYDNLTRIFGAEEYSGVGVSFGFERIMLLLEELNLLADEKASSKVLVTVFDEASRGNSIKIYNALLNTDVPSEIYLTEAKLAKQFKYADKKNIPFVVVQGPDEQKSDSVIVRRMSSGNQKQIPLNQLPSYIAGYYEAS